MKRSLVVPASLIAVLAAVTAPATGSTGEVIDPDGYTLQISEVGGDQTNAAFDWGAERPPVTVARVTVSLGKPGRQAAAAVTFCSNGHADLGRVRLRGTSSNSDFGVRYTRASDGANITSAVVAGTFRTARLSGNQCATYRVTITRSATAVPGDIRTFTLSGDPATAGWRTLSGATKVVAYRCIKLC